MVAATQEKAPESHLRYIPGNPKELARYSLAFFAHYYLDSHFDQEIFERQFELMNMLDSFKGGDRALVMFPRHHGKSTTANFAKVLHAICFKLKRNIGIGSDSGTQAKEFLRNIKTELEFNERIRADFGDLTGDIKRGGKWDETHIITRNFVQVKVLTPGMAVRGMNYNYKELRRRPDGTIQVKTKLQRPDLIVLDDILNAKTIKNKDVRDKLDAWLFKDIISAMDKDRGDLILIGTPLHNDDLLMRVWKDTERAANWRKWRTPACQFDDKGEPTQILWPGYWSKQALLQKMLEIGTLAFAQEYLLNPIDESSVFFRHDWFRWYNDGSMPAWMAANMAQSFVDIEPMPDDLICVTGIDPNIKQKDKSDYTVVATLGYSPARNAYYLLDIYRDRPSPEAQIEEMINQKVKWDREYNKDGFYHIGFAVETFGYQHSIMHWLRKKCKARGLPHVRVVPLEEHGVDKTLRISEMSPMVERRQLVLPVGARQAVTGQLLVHYPMMFLQDELCDFPNGANDDGVDALHRCYAVLRREERKYVRSVDSGSELDTFLKRIREEQTGEVVDLYSNVPAA